jgi:hypothetical protein
VRSQGPIAAREMREDHDRVIGELAHPNHPARLARFTFPIPPGST